MIAVPAWLSRFVLGVAAGLTAQGLVAVWRWLRAPAVSRG